MPIGFVDHGIFRNDGRRAHDNDRTTTRNPAKV
jgi:hypothetical protein